MEKNKKILVVLYRGYYDTKENRLSIYFLDENMKEFRMTRAYYNLTKLNIKHLRDFYMGKIRELFPDLTDIQIVFDDLRNTKNYYGRTEGIDFEGYFK